MVNNLIVFELTNNFLTPEPQKNLKEKGQILPPEALTINAKRANVLPLILCFLFLGGEGGSVR